MPVVKHLGRSIRINKHLIDAQSIAQDDTQNAINLLSACESKALLNNKTISMFLIFYSRIV
jgi:hypothetical protein